MTVSDIAVKLEATLKNRDDARIVGWIRESRDHFGQEFTVVTPDGTYKVIVAEVDAAEDIEWEAVR